jgi:phage terminase large subunit-like protein
VATTAYDRHKADCVVGEQNYGGAMVQHTIQTARARTPYKAVTATRGKVVRAEPFSSLYSQGKVRHVGDFRELEDELCAISTNGYTGEGSPNRADAWIWVLAELFPSLVKAKAEDRPKPPPPRGGWMG